MPGGTASLVLAGGRATRLGGGDKTLRQIGGRPLLAHIIDRLAPQVGTIAISANGDPARFAEFGLEVLADDVSCGPLSGLLAGLRWARRRGFERLLSVAGDTPFLPLDLAARLAAAAQDGEAIAVASAGGRRHPVFGLWPVLLEGDLKSFLAETATFSVSAFLDRHATTTVDFPLPGDSGVDPFFNVNTPDDLAEADHIMQGGIP